MTLSLNRAEQTLGFSQPGRIYNYLTTSAKKQALDIALDVASNVANRGYQRFLNSTSPSYQWKDNPVETKVSSVSSPFMPPRITNVYRYSRMKRKRSYSYAGRSTKRPRTGGVYKTKPYLSHYSRIQSIERQAAGNEPHYNDITELSDANTTPVFMPLNSIGIGTTNLLRLGKKIMMKTLALRIHMSSESVLANPSVRILVIYDKQANNGAFNATDLLQTATIASHTNITAFGRFKCLWDKVICLNATSDIAGTAAVQTRFIKKFIKFPIDACESHYNVDTASTPYTGGLSILYFSDQGPGTSDCNMDIRARLKFLA